MIKYLPVGENVVKIGPVDPQIRVSWLQEIIKTKKLTQAKNTCRASFLAG